MNIVVLSGRLTKNIEVQTTSGGTAYTRFSIAVDRYQGKDKEKKTNFVDCIAFGHSCNFLAKYCAKGSFVTVHGELDSNTKERDDGSKVTYWNVIVNSVEASKPAETPAVTQPAPMPVPPPEEPIMGDNDALPFEL